MPQSDRLALLKIKKTVDKKLGCENVKKKLCRFFGASYFTSGVNI